MSNISDSRTEELARTVRSMEATLKKQQFEGPTNTMVSEMMQNQLKLLEAAMTSFEQKSPGKHRAQGTHVG